MTLHLLEIAPRDVAAEALGLLLDAPAPPALAELVLTRDHDRLVLGVLGSSHVVQASSGALQCVEEVSCDAVAAGGLPLPEQLDRAPYSLRSSSRTVPAAELDDLARQLRTTAAQEDAWLCGAFPTSGAAVTALTGAADGAGWAWRTWHLYPGATSGVVVTTASRWQP